jgi:hypothetical protein
MTDKWIGVGKVVENRLDILRTSEGIAGRPTNTVFFSTQANL